MGEPAAYRRAGPGRRERAAVKKEKSRRLRTMVRWISYSAGAFLVVLGFALSGWHQAHVYKRQLEYNYQNAFAELAEGITAIDTALQKGRYAYSPAMTAALANEIGREASLAQTALSNIPNSFSQLEKTSQYLSRVGDYAYMLSRKVASGGTISDDERREIQTLTEMADALSQELNELEALIQEENLPLGAFMHAKKGMETQAKTMSAVSSSFQILEEEFPEFPSLIYDGPFSAHVDRREAVFLKDKKEISREEALAKAAAFINADKGILRYDGDGTGRVPVYSFSARMDGGELSVDVTRRGGFVLNLLNSRDVTEARLTPEEGVTKAAEFLKAQGFASMQEIYWFKSDNRLAVNFAYKQDDVLCYPDLIKVSVALDSGRVVGFESLGYMMNHQKRAWNTPAMTAQEIRKQFDPSLTVDNTGLALIPSPGENEILCHQFTCTSKEKQTVVIYSNAQTGLEEKILILLKLDGGTLAI